MMPFFGGPLHHIGPLRPSAGRSSTLSENFAAGFHEQHKVESAFGFEAELAERYNANLDRIREVHGEDLRIMEMQFARGEFHFLRMFAEKELGKAEGHPNFMPKYEEQAARLEKLKELDPEVKTFPEILQEVVEMQQGVREDAASASERSGFWGGVAQFAGAVVGSFSPRRDPLLVGSLFFGGAGATIGRRMLAEFAIGSGVETVQQFGFVQPTHKLLGRDGGNPWLNIAAAGTGSALFRGGIDSAVPTYRAFERKLAPQRVLGRAMNEMVEGPMSLSRFDELFGPYMSNPTVRAARGVVDGDEMLRNSNPYGNSVIAQRQFLTELEQTLAAFDGRTSTAIPEGVFDNLPSYARELSFERALAENQFPAESARLVRAETRVAEFDQRIDAMEKELAERTVADAVNLIDPPTAQRLRQIEEELQRPGVLAERLERERDMLVETLGEDAIARAEKDWRIGPRKQLRDARRSRQAAVRERNRAQREIDQRLADLRRDDAQVARVRELLGVPQVRAGAREVAVEVAEDATLRAPRDIRLVADEVGKAEARLDETSEAIVDRNATVKTGVDVDTPENLPNDMEVPVLDDAGQSTTVRAGDAMRDLAEDKSLIEAMRACAI